MQAKLIRTFAVLGLISAMGHAQAETQVSLADQAGFQELSAMVAQGTASPSNIQNSEEFPPTRESYEIIQQFDRDYDRWNAQTSQAKTLENTNEAGGKTTTSIRVEISKKLQSMAVYVNGLFSFKTMVSTGMKGKATPSGSWTAKNIERVHFSRAYNAPLPWAIQVNGGYFIHGATPGAIDWMKKKIPHSHGCIRVPPTDARKLYDLVKTAGLHNTKITIN